jgi:hypothetical protein
MHHTFTMAYFLSLPVCSVLVIKVKYCQEPVLTPVILAIRRQRWGGLQFEASPVRSYLKELYHKKLGWWSGSR